MSSSPPSAAPPLGIGEACARLLRWCAARPLQAVLLAACLATFIGFFFFVRIWVSGAQTTFDWAWNAWNHTTGEQYHGRFVALVSLGLLWYHRGKIAAAPKKGSNWGLIWLGLGITLYVVGARCLQPRMGLLAIPFLVYGAILFVWGRHVARIALFPCAFLVFMIPVAALEQATFKLQFVITGAIGFLSQLVGIGIQAVGTTLTARDGSFNFEIAEGCSGVRSLTAMSMLTAIYVHLTQDRLWKKGVIFAASLLFAIFGNVGRLFTIILVAKFISQDFAGGLYHDYSGFLFFPIGVLAMTGFSRLVNTDWRQVFGNLTKPEVATDKPGNKSISYDY